jgi:hypothetical protein
MVNACPEGLRRDVYLPAYQPLECTNPDWIDWIRGIHMACAVLYFVCSILVMLLLARQGKVRTLDFWGVAVCSWSWPVIIIALLTMSQMTKLWAVAAAVSEVAVWAGFSAILFSDSLFGVVLRIPYAFNPSARQRLETTMKYIVVPMATLGGALKGAGIVGIAWTDKFASQGVYFWGLVIASGFTWAWPAICAIRMITRTMQVNKDFFGDHPNELKVLRLFKLGLISLVISVVGVNGGWAVANTFNLFGVKHYSGIMLQVGINAFHPLLFAQLAVLGHFHYRSAKSTDTAVKAPPGPRPIADVVSSNVKAGVPAAMGSWLAPDRGVSLSFLRHFVDEFGISDADTTQEVRDNIVLKLTGDSKAAVFTCLGGGADGAACPWRGKPTRFVSHTWRRTFSNLVKCLEHHEAEYGSGQYYWIDIIALNQHATEQAHDEKENRALLIDLDTAINTSTAVVAQIDRWDEPVALQRIWCLFEMWRAIELGRPIYMGFPQAEAERFASELETRSADIEQMIASINIENAAATMQTDKDMIVSQVASTVGVDAFNECIRSKLRNLLLLTAARRGGSSTTSSHSPIHTPAATAEV